MNHSFYITIDECATGIHMCHQEATCMLDYVYSSLVCCIDQIQHNSVQAIYARLNGNIKIK